MQTQPSPVNTAGMLLRPKNKNASIRAALACSNALIDKFTDRLFKMNPDIETMRKLKVHLYQGDITISKYNSLWFTLIISTNSSSCLLFLTCFVLTPPPSCVLFLFLILHVVLCNVLISHPPLVLREKMGCFSRVLPWSGAAERRTCHRWHFAADIKRNGAVLVPWGIWGFSDHRDDWGHYI